MISTLLTLLVLGQTGIPSVTLPPQTEQTIVFTDNGTTYVVGLRSQTVTKHAGGISPTPTPTPTPTPVPPVVPTGEKPAWFSLVVDPSDTEGLTLRGDKAVRDALASVGVLFRAYASNQSEAADFGLTAAIGNKTLPAVVSQRLDGTVIDVQSVKQPSDIVNIVKGWEK